MPILVFCQMLKWEAGLGVALAMAVDGSSVSMPCAPQKDKIIIDQKAVIAGNH